jgi:hypothetical protein
MNWTNLNLILETRKIYKNNSFYGWTIKTGFVYHQGRKLKNADSKTFEIPSIDDETFIGRDKNYIYHSSSKEKTIDRNSFEIICNRYWKDHNNAYYEYESSLKLLKGNDAKNFMVIGGAFARDSKFAYYSGRYIKSCLTPLKLELIGESYLFAKDGEKIFLEGSSLKNADISTWKELNKGYSKDSKSVYFGSKKLPSAKVNTWKQLDTHPYSIDERSVYIMFLKIKNADPNSWEILNKNYSKDSSKVFYRGRLIENADPNSFIVISENQAKDKNGFFNIDKKV